MVTTRIILCPRCGGKGQIFMSELDDYHKGTYYEWYEPCLPCEGNGRLVEETTITTRKLVKEKEGRND